MAPERLILCGVPAPAAAETSPNGPVHLRMWEPGRNVHPQIRDVRRALYTDIPTVLLDLLDIAVYVYCADQAVTRGGGGVENQGENWRRNFVFTVPVRNPEVWRSGPAHDHLVSTLSFLSDDEYRFEFTPLTEEHPLDGYFDFGPNAYHGAVEDVVMFSGGLDSLAGAVQECVLNRRKVLLVHHRSSEKLTRRHDQLLDALRAKAGDCAPLHAVVRINKAEQLGREHTQRTRSFLFAALGATFAVMTGRDRLRFYENGVVSLNLPLSAQVVGARASRTTHPRVLHGYSRLVAALTGKPFAVENPFLWRTKTDVVKLIADAGCGDLIGRSTSCGHTWVMTNQHHHCGDCSQCIDRRFAVLAAGREDHDPEDGYAVRLLTDPRPETESRVLLAAYLETANQVERTREYDFFRKFGEVFRTLSHVAGDAETAARRVLDLYRRHAGQVTGVLDRAIEEFSGPLRRRTLDPTCLVRMVLDDGTTSGNGHPEPTADPIQPAADYSYRLRGQAWVVRFNGGPANVLLPSVGATYLHELLTRPDHMYTPAELALSVARRRDVPAQGDAGERVDRDALTAYRVRRMEAQQDLDRARENNDLGAIELAERELVALGEEIRLATGVGGQLRKVADERERVRKAVGIALRRVIEEIREFDPPLAEHLDRQVRCGQHPCYTSEPGVRWDL
jgi:7-cyano-7-deazaguanine synthase in queuosine biosynthesis